MLTKQDLDNISKPKPVIYKSVTICGRVCCSPEDIIRLGFEIATDPIKFEEYQQLMDSSFKKSLEI